MSLRAARALCPALHTQHDHATKLSPELHLVQCRRGLQAWFLAEHPVDVPLVDA